MKKSKFLKKSFALLLAVMLIVSMIPAGASAASTPPTLQALYVGTESASAGINGTSLSATVNDSNLFNNFKIASYVAKDNKGKLYIGNDNQAIPVTGGYYNLSSYVIATGVAEVPLRLVDDADLGNSTIYTLTIQNTTVANNVELSTFTLDNQISSTFEPGKLAFEIVMPYNTDLDATYSQNKDIKANITLSDVNATHNWNKYGNLNGDSVAASNSIAGGDKGSADYTDYSKAHLQVTSADKLTTVEYVITIRRAAAVGSFTFDEVVETTITDINDPAIGIIDGANTGAPNGYGVASAYTWLPKFAATENIAINGKIDIVIPKNAMADLDYLKKIVPEFTGEMAGAKVDLYNNGSFVKTLTSGTTEADLTDAYMGQGAIALTDVSPMTLVVSYPAGTGGKAVYNIVIKDESQSSQAVINNFRAVNSTRPGMFIEGEVKDDQLNVTINGSYSIADLNLDFDVSCDAKVWLNIPDSGNYLLLNNTTSTVAQYNTYETQNSPEYLPDRTTNTTVIFAAIDARKPMAIIVEAEDGTTKTYTLNVTSVASTDDAKINSVYLKNNKTGETYEGKISGVNITFKVPASTTISDIEKMNIYYSVPTGAELVYYNVNASGQTEVPFPRSSSKLDSTKIGQWSYNASAISPYAQLIPDPRPMVHSSTNSEWQEVEWVVRTYGSSGSKLNETNYLVKFEHEAWKTGSSIKSNDVDFTVARNATEYASVVDNKHGYFAYDALVGSGTSNGNTVKTLEVEIPSELYNTGIYDWGNDPLTGNTIDPLAYINVGDISLPDGAVLYIEDPNNLGATAKRYYGIKESGWSSNDKIDVSNGTSLADWFTLYGVDLEDLDSTVRVFVVNEKGYYDCAKVNGTPDTLDISATTGIYNASNAGNVSVYYLRIQDAAERSAKALNSVSLIDETGYEVKGTISGNEITFNVPYSWATATGTVNSPLNDNKKLRFVYDAAPGNFLRTVEKATFGFSGGLLRTDGTQYDPVTGNDYLFIFKNGNIGSYVDSRAGNQYEGEKTVQLHTETGAVTDYGMKINIKPVETGALFTSFSLNGVSGQISGNTINVKLPYKTDLSAIAPVFTTSTMATVYFDETGAEIQSGKQSFDFSKDVVLAVVSEDQLTTTKYTVKVSTPLSFSDVQDQSQWYYSWVYRAAELGIVTGYPDGTFKPLSSVKRGDFAVMLARACEVSEAELATYTDNPFLDVDASQYYAQAIAWAAEKGYVNGYNNATFKPTQEITRQEVAAILCRVKGLSTVTDPTTKFADDHLISTWAKGYVYACKNDGIMEGKENNLFAPLKNMTRAETAKVMVTYYDAK